MRPGRFPSATGVQSHAHTDSHVGGPRLGEQGALSGDARGDSRLGPANAKNNPSPSQSTSTPPWLATAPLRSSRCLSSTPAYRPPIRRSNRVDPSMSVNTKVTVPPGKGERKRGRTGSSVSRAERRVLISRSGGSSPGPCGFDFSFTMASRAYKPTVDATGSTELEPDPLTRSGLGLAPKPHLAHYARQRARPSRALGATATARRQTGRRPSTTNADGPPASPASNTPSRAVSSSRPTSRSTSPPAYHLRMCPIWPHPDRSSPGRRAAEVAVRGMRTRKRPHTADGTFAFTHHECVAAAMAEFLRRHLITEAAALSRSRSDGTNKERYCWSARREP